MGINLHNAYVGIKDMLFDVMHDEGTPETIARIAGWVLAHLPVTASERELYVHLFGYDGNPLVFDKYER